MTRRESESSSDRQVGSDVLADALTKVTEPLTTAKDQLPPPDSHWTRRGWAGALRSGGFVVDAMPKATSTGMLLLRLLVAVLVWVVLLAVVLEVLVLWAIFVLPVRALLARSKEPKPGGSPPPGAPIAHGIPGPGGVTPPPVALAQAAPPAAEAAVDHCSMCGGSTEGSCERCSYCGSRLPVIEARGWHTDPLGSGGRRWFDGQRWTEHVEC